MSSVSPKVTAATAAAAVTTISVWGAGLLGVEVPAEVQGAATTLLVFGAGWLISDPARRGKRAADE